MVAIEENVIAQVMELRHELHMHPELSMQEINTRRTLISFLRKNTTAKIYDNGDAFCCVFGENLTGIPVGFRADIDALPIEEDDTLPYHSTNPGASHKCGHDGHAACLCGLALHLQANPVKHPVWLIFEPGEEIGAGGKICAEMMKKHGIQEVYAFHNLEGYPENSIVIKKGLTQPASVGLRIIFQGKSSHAGSPEEGSNPAAVIARTLLYAQETARRASTGMVMCCIVGVRIGNGDFGINPGDGELLMTLRAEYENEMNALKKDIIRFANEQASAAGITVSYQESDYFPETRNTELGYDRVRSAAEKSGKKFIEMNDIWRASEDFGYYTRLADGAIFYIGTGEKRAPLHTKDYDFNDRIIKTAIEMFYQIAL